LLPRGIGDGNDVELVARPLRALSRHDLQSALGREIEEARGEGGDAEIGVT
jgi:hypothetical protein